MTRGALQRDRLVLPRQPLCAAQDKAACRAAGPAPALHCLLRGAKSASNNSVAATAKMCPPTRGAKATPALFACGRCVSSRCVDVNKWRCKSRAEE